MTDGFDYVVWLLVSLNVLFTSDACRVERIECERLAKVQVRHGTESCDTAGLDERSCTSRCIIHAVRRA